MTAVTSLKEYRHRRTGNSDAEGHGSGKEPRPAGDGLHVFCGPALPSKRSAAICAGASASKGVPAVVLGYSWRVIPIRWPVVGRACVFNHHLLSGQHLDDLVQQLIDAGIAEVFVSGCATTRRRPTIYRTAAE